MEPNIQLFCSLCQEPIKKNQIQFSCNHIFCFQCFPYILLNIIGTEGIKKDFFGAPKIEYSCMICRVGKALLPINLIANQNDVITDEEGVKNKEKNKLCERCMERASMKYCKNCKYNYCNECLNLVHGTNIFNEHEIEDFKEKIVICKCPSGRKLENFCIKCLVGICNFCSFVEHKDHKKIPYQLFKTKFEQIDMNSPKKSIQKLIEDFAEIKENFEDILDISSRKQDKEFYDLLKEIRNSLTKLEMSHAENLINSKKTLETKFSLIFSTLLKLNEELERNLDLNANKIYQLCNFFLFPQEFIVKNFEISLNNDKLKNILKKISILEQNMAKLPFNHFNFDGDDVKIRANNIVVPSTQSYFNSRFLNKNDYIYSEFYENFKSDPIELIHKLKEGFLLEKGNFVPRWIKSNVSCSFILNNKTFIAWAVKNRNSYPILVYDLSNKRREFFLNDNSNFTISILSKYPKYSLEDTRWLFSGDNSGVLRIYDLNSKLKPYTLIHKIEANLGKGILSAIIFKDKFNEIQETNFPKKMIYALISFNDQNLPIKMYSFNEGNNNNDSKWEFFREIVNPLKQECYTLNFFHDEDLLKTWIFFGFGFSFIKNYQLKSNKFGDIRFQTENHVTSIQFIFRERKLLGNINKFERYMIYTQSSINMIVVANIDDGIIIKKVALENVEFINDLCIWNNNDDKNGNNNLGSKNYLIVATNNENSIKILNFEDLTVLKSVKLDKNKGDTIIHPTNLIKVLRKGTNKNELKEGIVYCQYCYKDDEYKKIILFE